MNKSAAIFVIVLISGVNAQATIIYTNSNFRIEDEIQYTVMTDKAIYQLGDHVYMQCQVTNLSATEEKLLWSANMPPYTFNIIDQGDNLVISYPGIYLPVVLKFPIQPLETKIYPEPWSSQPDGLIWDMKEWDGNIVDLGVYEVYAIPPVLFPPVSSSIISVPIQIIPEPTSLVLLSLGLLLVKKKKRNRI